MEELLIENFNYPLPDERIAKYPLTERDHSKLLVYRDGTISEDRFDHVGKYITPGALLIYNNTRVIQARLAFRKSSGARIEVFCLEPMMPHDYQLSLSATDGCVWKCMVGNLKKWKEGKVELHAGDITLYAEHLATMGNTHEIRFTWQRADNETASFAEVLDAAGELPIPPYLNRKTEASDLKTYQTVYSRIKGSVAAPTAGLHFTERVLDDLHEQGVETDEVTLHVGAGTFLPVKAEDANQHTMHTEIIAVPLTTIRHIQTRLGHIVAVGTTSMRTLESLYFIGRRLLLAEHDATWQIHVGQFEPYEPSGLPKEPSAAEALQAIADYMEATGQEVLHAETQIMIRPGYTFHVVDQLITNFHQPKSTLLLLVSAFVGGDWRTIYNYALSHDFRFLSYGDSSILWRHD